MKRLSSIFRKGYERLIVLLLGFMGLATRCMPVAEYGTPHADFHLKGNITGAVNKQPIENILVKVYLNDTLMINQGATDTNGEYAIDLDLFPIDQQIKLTAEDTDGTENGSYLAADTLINIDVSNLDGGDGHWYEGEMDIQANFSLDEENVK